MRISFDLFLRQTEKWKTDTPPAGAHTSTGDLRRKMKVQLHLLTIFNFNSCSLSLFQMMKHLLTGLTGWPAGRQTTLRCRQIKWQTDIKRLSAALGVSEQLLCCSALIHSSNVFSSNHQSSPRHCRPPPDLFTSQGAASIIQSFNQRTTAMVWRIITLTLHRAYESPVRKKSILKREEGHQTPECWKINLKWCLCCTHDSKGQATAHAHESIIWRSYQTYWICPKVFSQQKTKINTTLLPHSSEHVELVCPIASNVQHVHPQLKIAPNKRTFV